MKIKNVLSVLGALATVIGSPYYVKSKELLTKEESSAWFFLFRA